MRRNQPLDVHLIRHPRRRLRITTALALVVLALPVLAGDLPLVPNLGPALLLRLEGTRAQDASTAKRIGFTCTSLGILGRPTSDTVYLGVDDARTVGGDQPLDGKDVLDAVAPFSPSFLVTGDPTLVDRLVALPVGTRVRLEGLVERGARTLLLRSVDALSPPANG